MEPSRTGSAAYGSSPPPGRPVGLYSILPSARYGRIRSPNALPSGPFSEMSRCQAEWVCARIESIDSAMYGASPRVGKPMSTWGPCLLTRRFYRIELCGNGPPAAWPTI